MGKVGLDWIGLSGSSDTCLRHPCESPAGRGDSLVVESRQHYNLSDIWKCIDKELKGSFTAMLIDWELYPKMISSPYLVYC